MNLKRISAVTVITVVMFVLSFSHVRLLADSGLPEVSSPEYKIATNGIKVSQVLSNVSHRCTTLQYPYYAFVYDNCTYVYDLEKGEFIPEVAEVCRKHIDFREPSYEEASNNAEAWAKMIWSLEFERQHLLRICTDDRVLVFDLMARQVVSYAKLKFASSYVLWGNYAYSTFTAKLYKLENGIFALNQECAFPSGSECCTKVTLQWKNSVFSGRVWENSLIGFEIDLEDGTVSELKTFATGLDPGMKDPRDLFTRTPGDLKTSNWNGSWGSATMVSGKDILLCVLDETGLEVAVKKDVEPRSLQIRGYEDGVAFLYVGQGKGEYVYAYSFAQVKLTRIESSGRSEERFYLHSYLGKNLICFNDYSSCKPDGVDSVHKPAQRIMRFQKGALSEEGSFKITETEADASTSHMIQFLGVSKNCSRAWYSCSRKLRDAEGREFGISRMDTEPYIETLLEVTLSENDQ